MAYSEEDLEQLRTNIASGVAETRFADGRAVRMQPLADLIAAEGHIASSVAGRAPNGRRRRRTPGYQNGC